MPFSKLHNPSHSSQVDPCWHLKEKGGGECILCLALKKLLTRDPHNSVFPQNPHLSKKSTTKLAPKQNVRLVNSL